MMSLPMPMIIWESPSRAPPAAGLGARPVHGRAHAPNCAVEPAAEGLADQEMTDIEFDDGRDAGDRPDCVEAEAVSGMAFEAQIVGMVGGPPDALELVLAGVVGRFAICSGMELDHRRPERVRGIELMCLGLDEH